LAMPAISTGLHWIAAVDADDNATALAESLLARIGHDIPLIDGASTGQADGMTWSIVIAPWTAEGDAAQHAGVTLHRVAVTVTWPGISQPKSRELITRMLAPPPDATRPA